MVILKFKGIGQADKRRCRVCGCTQFHACPGGCYWVSDDLCSRCLRFSNVFTFGKIPSEEKASVGLAEACKNATKNQLVTSDKIEKLRSLGLTQEEITIIQKAIPNKRFILRTKDR